MRRLFFGLTMLLAACMPAGRSASPTPPMTQTPPQLTVTFGAPITFATHAELVSAGFRWGPSDGLFGAIAAGGGSYTFYGTAGASAACAGSPTVAGAFTFAGTLDHFTGSHGCKRLFGPGDGPAGWLFDKNYEGGGQVVRFAGQGQRGYLMSFHGEYQWSNPASADHLCYSVPCFYSGLGLAVSTDGGQTFKNVGQILQPSQPLSQLLGGSQNYGPGYGVLLVADANGQPLDNPPPDPALAYFYLFYGDSRPGLPGVCAHRACAGLARAKYADVVAAALSGDPHQVARLFHKYDGSSSDPWGQPATSDTPDLSGTAGQFAPLWTDQGGGGSVLYDRAFGVYLTANQMDNNVYIRASQDLIHWSAPLATYSETGRTLWYPNLLGETGDPAVGGPAPRLYFSSFPQGQFPQWSTSVFESVPLNLSRSS